LNEKPEGLLDAIRVPDSFRGDLGETIVLVSPRGSLEANKLLIIGLGDSETYTPKRMDLVGSIVFREANRMGIRHPFFALTALDGGVLNLTLVKPRNSSVQAFYGRPARKKD
jgi:hypothetical protein